MTKELSFEKRSHEQTIVIKRVFYSFLLHKFTNIIRDGNENFLTPQNSRSCNQSKRKPQSSCQSWIMSSTAFLDQPHHSSSTQLQKNFCLRELNSAKMLKGLRKLSANRLKREIHRVSREQLMVLLWSSRCLNSWVKYLWFLMNFWGN